MPIEVRCSGCGKDYRLKDELAGKKFRCKGCQGVVQVPAAKARSEDPWDDLDLDAYQEQPAHDEFDDDDEFDAPPTPRRRKKRNRKKSSAGGGGTGGGGRPVGVIIAIACECLLMLFNLASVVLTIMFGNPQVACGSVFRILLEGGIILGLLEANSATRWISIGLSALGIATGLLCGCGILAGAFSGDMQREFGDGAEIGMLVALVFQTVIWIVNMVMLLLPSSAEYFD